MLLNLFHATAQANAEGKHLLPDSVVKIRDQANVRKLADARKLLAEFLSQGDRTGASSEPPNAFSQARAVVLWLIFSLLGPFLVIVPATLWLGWTMNPVQNFYLNLCCQFQ